MKTTLTLLFAFAFTSLFAQVQVLTLNLDEPDTLQYSSLSLNSIGADSWIYTDANTTLNEFAGDTVHVYSSDTLMIKGFSTTNFSDLDRTIRVQYLDVNDVSGAYEDLVWTTTQMPISDFFSWNGELSGLVPTVNNQVFMVSVEIVDQVGSSNVQSHVWRFFLKLENSVGIEELQASKCEYEYYDLLGREIDIERTRPLTQVIRKCGNSASMWIKH